MCNALSTPKEVRCQVQREEGEQADEKRPGNANGSDADETAQARETGLSLRGQAAVLTPAGHHHRLRKCTHPIA